MASSSTRARSRKARNGQRRAATGRLRSQIETSRPAIRAVASYDDEGLDAAIDWCCEHMADDDTISVWTHLKSNLRTT
ncbi:hypothetical protein GCM10017567_05460 [Amycolatopsis bullii]|uniref:Uncharacterized protein n=1 Tax=Amycolatopsis bullii TaxID=941987 RepID=A0ABQ3K018_9PSEU|nr:hypothetical protein GCM10017567_05460 [Amycolatopsis bullii]